MVADDNDLNQDIMLDLLADCGSDVTLANNGQEVLDLLGKETFDIILMDIQMPVMDGLEATSKIRLNDIYKKLPIIALTANATQQDMENGLAIGMNEYLTKPIIPQELFGSLSRWCHKKEGGAVYADPFSINLRQPNTGIDKVKNEEEIEKKIMFKGLDVQAGLKTCNGKEALFEKLIVKFSKKYHGFSDELLTVLHDTKQAKALVHNLTGVAANIGALLLSGVSREVDKILVTQILDGNSAEIKLLNDHLKQVLESIDEYLALNAQAINNLDNSSGES